MLIELLTCYAGPLGQYQAGERVNFDPATAKALLDGKYAKRVEAPVETAEQPVVVEAPVETAEQAVAEQATAGRKKRVLK